MSLESLFAAALLGVTAYPFLGNMLPNQRKNAQAAMGCIVLLGLLCCAAPPMVNVQEHNVWFALASGVSSWLFTVAYANRVVGEVRQSYQSLAWPTLCFVCVTVAVFVGGFESIVLACAVISLVLVGLLLGYRGLSRLASVKALAFAALYVLVFLCVQLQAQAIVVSALLPQFTTTLTWILAVAAVAHMLIQDRLKIAHVEFQKQERRIETAAMQIAYTSRRVLKDFRHDLRQPLSTLGILASVGKAIAKDAEVSARYQHIQTAQKALKQMMEEFFVQLEEAFRYPNGAPLGLLKPVRLRDVIEPLVEEYRLLAKAKGLELRYSPSTHEGLTQVEALTKILRNGLDNAIKYTERGGVLIGVRGRGKRVLIQIVDTGPGVHTDPANQSNKGWGYGSTIVQELSEQIHAHTDCKNRVVGHRIRGSIFQVALPSTQDRQLLTSHDQKRADTGLIVRVMAPSNESLECAQNHMPSAHFDQIEFKHLRGGHHPHSIHSEGQFMVYVFYAGSDQERDEALQAVEGLQSGKKNLPCLVTVCPANAQQRKSVVFKENAIHIAYKPGEPEQGFKILSELFPLRSPAQCRSKQEETEQT